MASSKEYLAFVLDQLSGLGEITYKAMMGEFVIYYRGKVIGGIYDDNFLVKNVDAAAALMPEAELTLPYEGGRPMLQVDDLDDRAFLRALVETLYAALPEPKRRTKRSK